MTEDITIRISDKRNGVFTVDNVVLNHYGQAMGATGIATYVTLCRYANNQTQQCFPSLRTIERETGMRRETIIDCFGKLERLKLLKREVTPGRVTNYTLLEPVAEGEKKEEILKKYYAWYVEEKMVTGTNKRTTSKIMAMAAKKDSGTEKRTSTNIRTTTGTNISTTLVRKSGHERTNITNLTNELNNPPYPPTVGAGEHDVKKSSLKYLTEEVCTEIAGQYQVSLQAVLERREDLRIYCASKGKVYKDYYATLQGWVREGLKSGRLKRATAVWQPPAEDMPFVDPAERERKVAEIKETLSRKLAS